MVNNFGVVNKGRREAVGDPSASGSQGGSDYVYITMLPGHTTIGSAPHGGFFADQTAPPTYALAGTTAQSQCPTFQFAYTSAKTYAFINIPLPNDYSPAEAPVIYLLWDTTSTDTTKYATWESKWLIGTPQGTRIFDAMSTRGIAGANVATKVPSASGQYLTYSKLTAPAGTSSTYVGYNQAKGGDILTCRIDAAITGATNIDATPNVYAAVICYRRA